MRGSCHIHQRVAVALEGCAVERLCEYVGLVILSRHLDHLNHALASKLAHLKHLALEMA